MMAECKGYEPIDLPGWCRWCGPPEARFGRCTEEPKEEAATDESHEGGPENCDSGELKFPDLRDKYISWIHENRSSHYEQRENHASSLGEPCERLIYLARTGAESTPISDELHGIFQLGHDYEDLARVNYRRMGYSVSRSQEKFRCVEDGETLWVGKTDGVLTDLVTGEEFAHDTKSVRDASRLSEKFAAKYKAQMLCYMSPDGLDMQRGIVVLYDKMIGLPGQIDIEFDPKEYEELKEKARRINLAVKSKEPPPFTDDAKHCASCRYYGVGCFPSVDIGATGIIDDKAIATQLNEAIELEVFAADHKALDKALKLRFKGNPDGTYTTTDGIVVTIKTSKNGARRIAWKKGERS